MEPKTQLKNVDFKNLTFSNLVLMYDLLLIDFPNLQGNVEAIVFKFREVYGVDITEQQAYAVQEPTINDDITDLKLLYGKL